MGRAFKPLGIITDQIINGGLIFLEAFHIGFQGAVLCGGMGRAETHQFQQSIAALKIFIQPFFDDRAEIVPNAFEGFVVMLGAFFKLRQNAARDTAFDGRQNRAFLNHLA